MRNFCSPTSTASAALAAWRQQAPPPVTPLHVEDRTPYDGNPNKPVPVHSFFMNRTSPVPDVYAYLAERRLEIGHDAVPYLEQFDNLRLVAFTASAGDHDLTRNLLADNSGYDGRQQFVLVGTRHLGIPGRQYDEVLGALPVDAPEFFKSGDLYSYLRGLTQNGGGTGSFEVPVSKSELLKRVRYAYNGAVQRASPPRLVKQPGNGYSLEVLAGRYGSYYPHLFSGVYAVTDTRGGRFPQEMVGKSVVFYAKFPRRDRTVDELLQQGAASEELGYLPLDEGVGVRDLPSLLAMLEQTAADAQDVRGRLLLSDNILKRLFKSLYQDSTLSTQLHKEFSDRYLNQDLVTGTDGRQEIKATRINRDMLLDQLHAIAQNPELKEAFERAMQDPKYFPNGVYISPVIVRSEDLKQEPVAKVYESEANRELLYSRLLVTGLSNYAISAPAFDLDLSPETTTRQEEIAALLREEPSPSDTAAAPLQGSTPSGTLDLTPAVLATPTLHTEEATLSELMHPFGAYKLTAMDLSEFVRSEISPMLMTDNSANFTQRLQAYLDQNTNC